MKHLIPIIVVGILLISGFVTATKPKEIELLDNHPPYVPSNFYPDGEDIYYDIDVNLSWDGGDPDPDDTVIYDIFFEEGNPDPEWVATVGPYPANQTRIYYDLDPLEYCKSYYMKIAASDNHGASVESPVWTFDTICPLYPPEIYGPTSGKAGIKYDYEFVQYNPQNYELSYFIDWGDNITTGWTEYYLQGVGCTRNHTWLEEGKYTIRAKVKNEFSEESDWGYLDVTMPKSHNPIWWLNNLLDRFPLLQRLLEWLMW